MKASERIKESLTFSQIMESIGKSPKSNFKYFIPHFDYVSIEVQSELINAGYKVYLGEWFRGDSGLIIEW